MKKILIVVIISILVISLAAFYLTRKDEAGRGFMAVDKTPPPNREKAINVDFTASFEIYTLGTKRVFTNAMYHNLSPSVYIESTNPGIIYVKEGGVTWQDFFDTLPFSLDKNCLTTGTKQTFCTNENGMLVFLLNGSESPNALELEIQPGDMLVVEYNTR